MSKKVENTVNKKLEKKTEEETSKAMDTLLGNKGDQNSNPNEIKTTGGPAEVSVPATREEEIKMYTKSDWVPGEEIILSDDFGDDPIGDFPQLWNTNGSGELVTLSDNPKQKWLKLYNYTWYEPDLPKDLSRDFTVEFDTRTFNIKEDNTSQTAGFYVYLGDGEKPLKYGSGYVSFYASPFPKWVKEQTYKSFYHENGGEVARGNVNKDIRQAFQDGMHIGISVKGQRYRVYINGEKFVDSPRALSDTERFGSILFYTYGLADNQAILISNLRVAEGLPEPREKLFKTGSYSTTAITFDVDSDQLKPEAFGILKKIAEAIKAEPGKKLMIVGHTDSDGSKEHNLDLSARRAASVKDALVHEFGVEPDRLSTEGKGENVPIASNDSNLEKAKNRRTEFIIK
ncbi:OmpA family protein [Christiangramia echinicola]|uniref:OmpA family protein n=1 Tax=Christiangramia echinicola TaxID=279359 RepID=UPI00146EDDA7|nr:OmpA family protein [Christiangramia echinicola]